ncbi:UNVERIFIED_CONTAM: hypothetical protein RMT77_007211 [Armadillidium vulgare]
MDNAYKIWCLYVIILLRLLEIHFAKSETILLNETEDENSVFQDIKSSKPNQEPDVKVMDVIVEKILKMESSLLSQEIKLEKFRSEAKEEMKTLRNATLLLLDLASGRGHDCQGVKDTATKIKILLSALAAYEPGLNYPKYEEDSYPMYDFVSSTTEDSVTTTEETTTVKPKSSEPTLDYKNNNLESRDLVLQSYNKSSTISRKIIPVTSVTPPIRITSTTPPIKITFRNFTLRMRTSSTTGQPATAMPLTLDTISSTTEREVPVITARKNSKSYNKFRKTYGPMGCPQGSRLVGRECFSVHLDQRLNWTSARIYCRKLGGDLAEPTLNNDKLPRQLLKSWPAFKESSYWTLWVGATDQEREGEWHWVTGGVLDLSKSPRWNIGEPVDEGESQDCLAMILWVPGRWQRWDLLDDPCDLEWHFFCEYSP